MEYANYIKPELAVLIAVLVAVGAGLKHSAVKDKLIPLTLGAAGIVLALKELVDGNVRVHLSITDQSDYCAAMVVVERE